MRDARQDCDPLCAPGRLAGFAGILLSGLAFATAVRAENRPPEQHRSEGTLSASLDASWLRERPSREASGLEPFFEASRRPLRTCVLITGERFHGELLRADQAAVEFRWHGHTRFRVPTAAVLAIENPPGVVDVLEQRLKAGESQIFAVDPVADGIAQLWWSPPPDVASPDSIWRLRFGDSELVLALPSSGLPEVAPPVGWKTEFRQPVRPLAAETSLAVRWTKGTWDIRIGPVLLMRGSKPRGMLNNVSVESASAMDHLTVRRFQLKGRIEASGPLDAVIRADGNVWYGEFLRTTDDGVELGGRQDAVTLISWTEFYALRFRARMDSSKIMSQITGRVAEFVGPSMWEPWQLEPERWIAADKTPWFASSVVEHPLLGQFRIANGDIDHRIATFPRRWQWLHLFAGHLGNNIEPDYQQPRPQGTRLSGTLTLIVPPTGATALSLDAVGLEPCGSGTPSTERFLSELQSGALRTELWINDERIGDWNSLLANRPRPGHAARLRLRVPPEHWHAGHNIWEIRQSPARGDATEFDDCELSRIAFESD